ncbi:three-Cys-motif partner protein TcmP [uncultured Chloroflexus sp.]|uniref:three-Cys-motif partner protein TcmP n=1 Tax=uncultured Chloroflexus sp. TaxID=214040 RepID=UPI00261824A7|nr:three-Cys-motif partner protein TcmP [uncultured Chloroflexus sp.]
MTTQHQFGGDWTKRKLEALRKYLDAYMKIFTANEKAKSFHTVYVDAFAGTGYRTPTDSDEPSLFPELTEQDNQEFLKGSASIALEMDKPFKEYLFIEQKQSHVAALEHLKKQFPERRIQIKQGDANTILHTWIRETNWRCTRAVVFLDPYGMQVEWSLIEAIAKTEAIDLWLLFPLGVGVNRLLTKCAPPPPTFSDRLTRFFGTEEWRDRFYHRQKTIFDEEVEHKSATFDSIRDFFIERLETVFKAVAKNPLVLTNSRNNPIYLLCFAAGNPKGAPTALKIADHILSHQT